MKNKTVKKCMFSKKTKFILNLMHQKGNNLETFIDNTLKFVMNHLK